MENFIFISNLLCLIVNMVYCAYMPEVFYCEQSGYQSPSRYQGILTSRSRCSNKNPEEMGIDMFIPERNREQAKIEKFFKLRRWPGGVIVYTISENFSKSFL